MFETFYRTQLKLLSFEVTHMTSVIFIFLHGTLRNCLHTLKYRSRSHWMLSKARGNADDMNILYFLEILCLPYLVCYECVCMYVTIDDDMNSEQ